MLNPNFTDTVQGYIGVILGQRIFGSIYVC